MYWIYEIPNSLFFVLCVCFFTLFSMLGVLLTRKWAWRYVGFNEHQNDAISYFFAGMGAIYGISLGLIAVGVWTTFNSIDDKVGSEAAAIAAEYRNFDGYPEPARTELQAELKDYTGYLIHEAWPTQQKGKLPLGGTPKINSFQKTLFGYEPKTNGQMALHQQAITQFNSIVVFNRERIANVTTALPASVWWVLIFGGLVTLAFSWMFVIKKTGVHVIIAGLIGALVGSLIFLIAAMDNPFRGDLSISSDALELVYDQLMK